MTTLIETLISNFVNSVKGLRQRHQFLVLYCLHLESGRHSSSDNSLWHIASNLWASVFLRVFIERSEQGGFQLFFCFTSLC